MSEATFKEMILYINAQGMAFTDIAKTCEVSRGCIDGIRNNVTKEPVHSAGEKIIKLYKSQKRAECSACTSN